jgi:NFACT N-terminal and middle domains
LYACLSRRYIRTKRCTDIRQLGNDRIVDLTFGSGACCNHLLLEFFANGNIILTDHCYSILAVLRSHTSDSDDVTIRVGELYPVDMYDTNPTGLPILDGSNSSGLPELTGIQTMDETTFKEWASVKVLDHQTRQTAQSNSSADKKDKLKPLLLKQLLLSKDSGVWSFGAEIIDHCILCAGLSPSHKVVDVIKSDGEGLPFIKALLDEFRVTAGLLLRELSSIGCPGYIIYSCPETPAASQGECESHLQTDILLPPSHKTAAKGFRDPLSS